MSLVLSIAANGEKLPPLLIFKGKYGKTIEKELQKHPLVNSGKIFAIC